MLELICTLEPEGEQGPLEPVEPPQSWTPPVPTGWNAMTGEVPDWEILELEELWLGMMGLLEKYLPSEMGGPAAKEGTPGEPLIGFSLVK
jgi:hypothetical protein